jgi:hypothetical protein
MKLRRAGLVARMKTRSVYRILVEKPIGKRPVGRSRRWEDDIKIDIRQIAYTDGRWTNGSGSWKTAGFGISPVKPSGSTTRALVN